MHESTQVLYNNIVCKILECVADICADLYSGWTLPGGLPLQLPHQHSLRTRSSTKASNIDILNENGRAHHDESLRKLPKLLYTVYRLCFMYHPNELRKGGNCCDQVSMDRVNMKETRKIRVTSS